MAGLVSDAQLRRHSGLKVLPLAHGAGLEKPEMVSISNAKNFLNSAKKLRRHGLVSHFI
jgi:hypothetical protein